MGKKSKFECLFPVHWSQQLLVERMRQSSGILPPVASLTSSCQLKFKTDFNWKKISFQFSYQNLCAMKSVSVKNTILHYIWNLEDISNGIVFKVAFFSLMSPGCRNGLPSIAWEIYKQPGLWLLLAPILFSNKIFLKLLNEIIHSFSFYIAAVAVLWSFVSRLLLGLFYAFHRDPGLLLCVVQKMTVLYLKHNTNIKLWRS